MTPLEIGAMRLLAREREASMHRDAIAASRAGAVVRRWVGERLVRVGAQLVPNGDELKSREMLRLGQATH